MDQTVRDMILFTSEKTGWKTATKTSEMDRWSRLSDIITTQADGPNPAALSFLARSFDPDQRKLLAEKQAVLDLRMRNTESANRKLRITEDPLKVSHVKPPKSLLAGAAAPEPEQPVFGNYSGDFSGRGAAGRSNVYNVGGQAPGQQGAVLGSTTTSASVPGQNEGQKDADESPEKTETPEEEQNEKSVDSLIQTFLPRWSSPSPSTGPIKGATQGGRKVGVSLSDVQERLCAACGVTGLFSRSIDAMEAERADPEGSALKQKLRNFLSRDREVWKTWSNYSKSNASSSGPGGGVSSASPVPTATATSATSASTASSKNSETTEDYFGYAMLPPWAIQYECASAETPRDPIALCFWDQHCLLPARTYRGRLCAQIYLALKYFPQSFGSWNLYLANASDFLLEGFRSHFDTHDWNVYVLFQGLLVLLDFYEGKFEAYGPLGLELPRESLRKWIIEILTQILDFETVLLRSGVHQQKG
ncbi:unnamed protein product [Amoebophrya sp. A25]|nr:unnamed protein product [Amoebophrya sp. A25]|eukprot:GSA25T00021913001.1